MFFNPYQRCKLRKGTLHRHKLVPGNIVLYQLKMSSNCQISSDGNAYPAFKNVSQDTWIGTFWCVPLIWLSTMFKPECRFWPLDFHRKKNQVKFIIFAFRQLCLTIEKKVMPTNYLKLFTLSKIVVPCGLFIGQHSY